MKRILSLLLALSLLFAPAAYAEISSLDVRTVYAAGTVYSLTNTAAALDFGTTDPSLELRQPGTYLLFARVTLKNAGATFAANRTATIKLSRTNNTAADVTGASTTVTTDIVTTQTVSYSVPIPLTLYTTTNNNDTLVIKGSISVVPTAGSIDTTEAEIIAIRLF